MATATGTLSSDYTATGRTVRWRSIPREDRVLLLLGIVVAVSGADLALTLAYMTTVGMMESNPIARLVVAHAGAWGLGLFKILVTSIGVGLLYRLRSNWQAEIGAWIATAILSLLAVQWVQYVTVFDGMNSGGVAEAHLVHDPDWVRLGHQGDR